MARYFGYVSREKISARARGIEDEAIVRALGQRRGGRDEYSFQRKNEAPKLTKRPSSGGAVEIQFGM